MKQQENHIVRIKHRGWRSHPELDKEQVWITFIDKKGKRRTHYWECKSSEKKMVSRKSKFIQKIAKKMGLDTDDEEIKTMVYYINCCLSNDPW